MQNKNMRRACEELWAKNKYYVLSKSHKTYLEIREYLKKDEVDISVIQEKLLSLKNIQESKKDFENAILHIWGYFKKDATKIEKQGLFDLIKDYREDKISQRDVIKYIQKLLEKYPNKYLEESSLLIGEGNETLA